MSTLLYILSVFLILSGMLFFLGAAVGVVRFPDFYTRMHAAGKGDTLSTILILLGVAVYVLADFSMANVLVAVKVLSIALLIMVTSPTSTHALMQAGYDDGLEPFQKERDVEKEGIQRVMIPAFDVIILIFLVVVAVIALNLKDLLASAMVLGVYSFLMCLLWAEMGAVDVAFTEAAVGAGVSTVIMIATVFQTTRRSRD